MTSGLQVQVAWRRADGRHGAGRLIPISQPREVSFALDDPAGRSQLSVAVTDPATAPGYARVNWRYSTLDAANLDVEITVTDLSSGVSWTTVTPRGVLEGEDPRALLRFP